MIHLAMARLQSRCLFKHVPGEANPGDLPSRADFATRADGTRVLNTAMMKQKDSEAAEYLNANFSHRELVTPTVAQLDDLAYFIQKPR
jgi:hypothetical protein